MWYYWIHIECQFVKKYHSKNSHKNNGFGLAIFSLKNVVTQFFLVILTMFFFRYFYGNFFDVFSWNYWNIFLILLIKWHIFCILFFLNCGFCHFHLVCIFFCFFGLWFCCICNIGALNAFLFLSIVRLPIVFLLINFQI